MVPSQVLNNGVHLRVAKRFLQMCLTEGASQVFLWGALVIFGLVGLAAPDVRVISVSIAVGLLFAGLMNLGRKAFERRNDPFIVSKLTYEFAMFEQGTKVRYTQELDLTSLRPNLELIRLRLAWSGDDSLADALARSERPSSNSRIEVYESSDGGKSCVFGVVFDTPLRKREKVKLRITVEMSEPDLNYTQFIAVGPAQYSYSLFPPTLTLRAISAEGDSFTDSARLSEYFHSTDFHLVRRQAVRVWEGRSLKKEGNVLSKKVWAFPQRSVYRFEFPTEKSKAA